MHKSYTYAILYFLSFSLLLVLSGFLLFDIKIGFSVQGVLDYYLGNEEVFTQEKTALGILKIVLPHIFAFALFSMVLLHFLVFTEHRDTPKAKGLIYLMFITALLEMTTPFFIINGYYFFAYVKLFSFFLFEGLIIYTGWLLFISIMKR